MFQSVIYNKLRQIKYYYFVILNKSIASWLLGDYCGRDTKRPTESKNYFLNELNEFYYLLNLNYNSNRGKHNDDIIIKWIFNTIISYNIHLNRINFNYCLGNLHKSKIIYTTLSVYC